MSTHIRNLTDWEMVNGHNYGYDRTRYPTNGGPVDDGERLLLELDGAIIRYLAAHNASLVESYRDPDDNEATTALIHRCTVDVRDAAAAIIEQW